MFFYLSKLLFEVSFNLKVLFYEAKLTQNYTVTEVVSRSNFSHFLELHVLWSARLASPNCPLGLQENNERENGSETNKP